MALGVAVGRRAAAATAMIIGSGILTVGETLIVCTSRGSTEQMTSFREAEVFARPLLLGNPNDFE